MRNGDAKQVSVGIAPCNMKSCVVYGEGLPGVLGKKGILAKYRRNKGTLTKHRREQRNMSLREEQNFTN